MYQIAIFGVEKSKDSESRLTFIILLSVLSNSEKVAPSIKVFSAYFRKHAIDILGLTGPTLKPPSLFLAKFKGSTRLEKVYPSNCQKITNARTSLESTTKISREVGVQRFADSLALKFPIARSVTEDSFRFSLGAEAFDQ